MEVTVAVSIGCVEEKKNHNNLMAHYYLLLSAGEILENEDNVYRRAMKEGKETRPVINKEDPKKEIEEVRNKLS